MKVKSFLKKWWVIGRLLKEGVSFTFNELKSNKFRTFLSLISVSIGIFTIIAILTAIDTLDKGIRQVFEDFNTSMVSVSRWPMGQEDDEGNQIMSMGNIEYKWWDYLKRPNITYDDYKFLNNNLHSAKQIVYSASGWGGAKYGRNSISSVSINYVTEGYNEIYNTKIERGRDFSTTDFNSSGSLTIIGKELANNLFGEEDPIGKYIKLAGHTFLVCGVLEEKGKGMFDANQTDDIAFVPYMAAKVIFNFREIDGEIDIIPKDGISNDDLNSEIKTVLRNYRRLRPDEKLNFSVNSINLLEDIIGQVIKSVTNVGWIIAIFSLLIGGFGIANIMFVSVKERTKIIGIEKALGAKKYFILIQFLTEAVILAVAGATVGILLVELIILIVPFPDNYQVGLSLQNVLIGVVIASVIGVLSGIIPAWQAANLDPVEAINSK